VTRPGAGLTVEAEDYLKAIYEISRGASAAASETGALVGTNALAERLGIAAASVSGMLGRLTKLGLVKTERYRGTRLTTRGRVIALQLIRRHRIIESYLVTRLGFAWEDVHDEAERLEHAASAELVDRMAHDLGNPTADPHGAPIPTADGDVDERRFATLASLEVGASARVQGMSDRDGELLRYLADRGITPGARVRVESREPFEGPITLAVGKGKASVSYSAASHVRVDGGEIAPTARTKSRRRR
jgi:DtxR family Mn-dependent transcriptional regulator